MGAAAAAAQHVAGHRQHVAPLLERAARGDERPALFARFDDHDGAREPADDPVAQREQIRERRRSRHELARDRAVLLHLARERRVLRRIHDVHARAHDPDGDAAGRQRAAVRGRVDAARQPADDGQPARREIGRKLFGHRQTVRRRRARADNRDRRRLECRDGADRPEDWRRVDNRRQRDRIRGIAPGHRRDAVCLGAIDRRVRARVQIRARVGLAGPMHREELIEHGRRRIAGAQALGDVQPGPRGKKGERDVVKEIGHGRTSNRRGATSNGKRPLPPRTDAQGPTSNLIIEDVRGHQRPRFVNRRRPDLAKTAGFSDSAVAYGLLVATREYGIVTDIQP